MQNIFGGVLLIAAMFTMTLTFGLKGKNVAKAAIATAIFCILSLLVFFVDLSSAAGR